MPSMTSEDMAQILELFGKSWAHDDVSTLSEIVKQFVADARIHQVARFAVMLHSEIAPSASTWFCDQMAEYL